MPRAQAYSRIGTSNYKGAKAGEWVSERVPGGIAHYRKGSGADPFASQAAPQQVARQTTKASKDYSKELREIANQMMQAADPFRGQREQYQQQLSALYKDPSSITQNPAYQFRLQQGQKALERSMAAKGMLGSGNLALELQSYGQQMASTEFDKEVNRLAMLSGAAPGSPAAGAQMGAGLLSAAAGEDFNRGGYAAYAQGLGMGAVPQASPFASPTTISRRGGGGWVDPMSRPTSLPDPFAGRDMAPPRLQSIATPQEPPPEADPVIAGQRSGAGTGGGWQSGGIGGRVGGGYGPPPGTGYYQTPRGGGTIGMPGTQLPPQVQGEETGDLGELDTDFDIWGTHF